jgi:hypothetical protein
MQIMLFFVMAASLSRLSAYVYAPAVLLQMALAGRGKMP